MPLNLITFFYSLTVLFWGKLTEVRGDFWISSKKVYSELISLGELTSVMGNLNLRYSNVEDLGKLEFVGGHCSFRDTKIRSLGSLKKVKGDLFLPVECMELTDISGVEVEGNVRYWEANKKYSYPEQNKYLKKYSGLIPLWGGEPYVYSYAELFQSSIHHQAFYNEFKTSFENGVCYDLEGSDNYAYILHYELQNDLMQCLYENKGIESVKEKFAKLTKHYPKSRDFPIDSVIEFYEDKGEYEVSFKLLEENSMLDIWTIIKYEVLLNRHILSGYKFMRLGWGGLTSLGEAHSEEIIPFVNEVLKKYEIERGMRFMENFIHKGDPYKAENNIVDLEYYKQFFDNNDVYENSRYIDDSQIKSGYINKTPHVYVNAIYSQAQILVREAENLFRANNGISQIGEGWISETQLFYEISKAFNKYEVQQHAHPEWLGRQHLDVFIPEKNIALEYQGLQHYQPVEFFGGEQAFKLTKERDARKKQLCLDNGCHLIYVKKGYDLNKVLESIKISINREVR